MGHFRFVHTPRALAEALGLDVSDPRIAALLALLADRDRQLEDYLDANT